jgi:hypothetical protein
MTEADRETLILAGQLSRIMCRNLEVEAYGHLQSVLNSQSFPGENVVPFLENLGRILSSLRWRVSWWTLLGSGGSQEMDIGKQRFQDRVNQLCRILYFYYFSMLRQIPSFTDKTNLRGVMSSYADTSMAIFDDFPLEESVPGFESWMKRGQQLIYQAGIVA